MIKIDLRILALDELAPWPELSKTSETATCDKVAILQRGTEQGKTSVMLGATMADGKVVFMQLSANAYETIWGAVKGARERFGDKP